MTTPVPSFFPDWTPWWCDCDAETGASTPTLDDTLLAVVQVTHEVGLPITGVSIHGAGAVMAHVERSAVRWWVRWLTGPGVTRVRPVVWDAGESTVPFHVTGTRGGIQWTVVTTVSNATAHAVLGAHGLTLSTDHQELAGDVAVALADALAATVLGGDV